MEVLKIIVPEMTKVYGGIYVAMRHNDVARRHNDNPSMP